jgi:hypothetical protein
VRRFKWCPPVLASHSRRQGVVPASIREIKDSTRRSVEVVVGALRVRVAGTGGSAGPASQRGQQQGLARKSLPPPMPGVLRLKAGQLASALVRPRRLRDPGATPTQGLREVPGGARKGPWVVLVNLPWPWVCEHLETLQADLGRPWKCELTKAEWSYDLATRDCQ